MKARKFKAFNRRLKKIYCDYKYIAVIERGSKGTERLHIHCLFFGLPYIPYETISEIWRYGHVDIRAIDEHGDVAGYILKYVEKTLTDDSYIPKGKKFYFTSQGLKQPKELYLVRKEFQGYIQTMDLQSVCHYEYLNIYDGDTVKYEKLLKH
ncbi:hypothetical protein [[Clostridium] innocuum]|uniref:rolling circle replication-associated protein n=1 Tax=Clostridium innocuum TaxID=1522 RepID=UPI0020A2D881|nr:hypothetical protein [[Clostridium] innocuum]